MFNYNHTRPHRDKGWFALDAKLGYTMLERVELAIMGTNVITDYA